MLMTPAEIRRDYQQAKDPARQRIILAELNDCKPEEINFILCDVELQPKKPAPIKHSICENRAIKLYATGISDAKIAQTLHVKPAAIWKWRKRRDLPPNVPACRKGTKKPPYLCNR